MGSSAVRVQKGKYRVQYQIGPNTYVVSGPVTGEAEAKIRAEQFDRERKIQERLWN